MAIFPTKSPTCRSFMSPVFVDHRTCHTRTRTGTLFPGFTSEAIPAVNCVSSSSINACIEAARKMDAPIMIQSLGSVVGGMMLNPWDDCIFTDP